MLVGDGPRRWEPEGYIEHARAEVLGGHGTRLPTVLAHAGLLLTCTGSPAEADRLLLARQEVTGASAAELVTDAVTGRALRALLAARGEHPAWARSLLPADPRADAAALERYLRQAANPPGGLRGDLAEAGLADLLPELVGGTEAGEAPAVTELRLAALEATEAARRGELPAVRAALERWSGTACAQPHPPVAMLAGDRELAGYLLGGALAPALGVDHQWARRCAGDVIAALSARHRHDADTEPASAERAGVGRLPVAAEPMEGLSVAAEPVEELPMAAESVAGLIEAIYAARAHPELPRPIRCHPADPDRVGAAEQRLTGERGSGKRLPADYRAFLLASDGLPADSVVPRLLGADELAPSADDAVVPISAVSELGGLVLLSALDSSRPGPPGRWCTVEYSPDLGATSYPRFRDFLEHHLRLLQR